MDRVLENYWCGMPENAGKCDLVSLQRGWYHYLKGGIALLENLFFGEKNMVVQEEADRRASLCLDCPHNVFPDRDKFVKWSDGIAEESTRGKRSKHFEDLGSCEICTCTLKAKVWHKSPEMNKEESEQAPDFCWAKRKET